MKFSKIFSVLFLLIPHTALAKIENKIIVKVENQIITNYEIKNKILTTLVLNEQEINQQNIDMLKEKSLDNLVLLKLKKIELDKYKIKKDDRKTQMYLQSISSNDINKLKKKIEENNLDYQLFLSEVETELMWQELIYKIYSKKIQINENEIEREINEILKIQSFSTEYNLSEIEININNFEKEKEKILDIEKILKNKKFEEVAKEFSISANASEGGNLGWIEAKSLNKNIFKAINSLKKGEVSKPIKKQNSVLFLKINDIKKIETKKKDKTTIKSELINKKKNQLFNLYSISHLSRLKNNSLIEYK